MHGVSRARAPPATGAANGPTARGGEEAELLVQAYVVRSCDPAVQRHSSTSAPDTREVS
jgi:hypothetical protein